VCSIVLKSGDSCSWAFRKTRHLTFSRYEVYFPIVLFTVAGRVRAILNLVRPDGVVFRLVYRIFLNASGLCVVWFLFKAGSWVVASNRGANLPGGHRGTVDIVNEVFYYILLFTAILSAGMLLFRILEFVQTWRWHGASRGVGAAAKQGP
jgi:hypothetical protein